MRFRTPQPPCPDAGPDGHAARTHRTAGGFTTVELLIVIGIVALLASIAVPSFRNSIESTRVVADAGDFVNDIKVARSAAITAGRSVVVCASADGSNCTRDSGWNTGRLVFFGDPGVTSPAQAEVIKKADAITGTTITDASASQQPVMAFNRNGFLVGGDGQRRLRVEGPSGDARRCLTLAPTGLSRLDTPTTGGPTCATSPT